jgi:hypothetical protein
VPLAAAGNARGGLCQDAGHYPLPWLVAFHLACEYLLGKDACMSEATFSSLASFSKARRNIRSNSVANYASLRQLSLYSAFGKASPMHLWHASAHTDCPLKQNCLQTMSPPITYGGKGSHKRTP